MPDTKPVLPVLLNPEPFAPWLLPSRPWATYLLLSANVLCFLIIVIASGWQAIFEADTRRLIQWGASYAPLTFSSQWWRLLSSGFLHNDIVHLSANMLILVMFGRIAQRLFGSFRFLIIYFMGAVAAALMSGLAGLLTSNNLATIGASGGICAMLAAHCAFIHHHRAELSSHYKQMMTSFAVYALFFVIFGAFGSTDNAAHLGGAIFGGLLGAAVIPKAKDKGLSRKDFVAIATSAVVLIALWFLGCSGLIDSEGLLPVYRAERLKDQQGCAAAAPVFKDLAQRYPKNETIFLELAICAAEQHDNKSASAYLDTALKLNPDYEPAESLASLTAFKEGDFEKCLRIWNNIPSKSKYKNAITARCISRIHGDQGKLDLALKEAEADASSAQRTKLMIYSQENMDPQACEIAAQMLKNNPNALDAIFAQLVASWRKGDYAQAASFAKELDDKAAADSQTRCYASFIYTIAALMNNDAHPDLLLDKNQSEIQRDKWTKTIADFLKQRVSADQFIASAQSLTQKTEANAYVGLYALAKHRPAEAKKYLEWVVKNGVPNFYEAWLAKYEFKRLENYCD